jgi:DNA repair protein RadA/Sms
VQASGGESVAVAGTAARPAEPALPLREVPGVGHRRVPTGLGELDRVLGGGMVPGAMVLVGGDPGIGKSTLLLQAAGALARGGLTVLYVSGEESLAQVSERGRRLGTQAAGLYLLAETALAPILAEVARLKPAVVVLDSVQTTWSDALESAAGSVSQVREVAGQLLAVAKRSEVGVWLIGHVTKDGSLAGPRALEHIVDTVVYFEGDRHRAYRILRATKNRFGPTDEIGLFEMRPEGLAPVENPSGLFLAERPAGAPGCVVVATLEGSRPILVEIQALVTGTGAALPRRVVNGLDPQRVAMVLAVLEKRLGVALGTADVFLNVVGGLEVREPAADLGVLAAVLSSARNIPVDADCAFFGEVGLGGEVRSVAQPEKRLHELQRLGFARAVVARTARDGSAVAPIDVLAVSQVGEVAALLGPPGKIGAKNRFD